MLFHADPLISESVSCLGGCRDARLASVVFSDPKQFCQDRDRSMVCLDDMIHDRFSRQSFQRSRKCLVGCNKQA